jgi:beta-galactosidase
MTRRFKRCAICKQMTDGVEVCRRTGGGRQVFIMINHTQKTQHVTLPRPMKLVLENGEASQVDLPAYGVSVLLENDLNHDARE